MVREHVSAADFARCERLFQKGTTPGQLLFLLPWVADQCSPEERAELLALAGPPLRLLLRLGDGRYARRRDLLKDPLAPHASQARRGPLRGGRSS